MTDGPVRPEKPATGRWRPWVLLVVLVLISGLLYSTIPLVPFLPLTTAQKVGLSAGLVAAEAVIWGAAPFLGGEVISRYRRLFDPRTWCREG